MKILFMGYVTFSQQVLEKLVSLGADIVGVVTKKQSPFNADFCDLSPLCHTHDIPVIYAEDVNDKDVAEWIHQRQPDVIFCFGISQLLKKHILEMAPMGVVGYHPAMLPANRGRHPLVWALVLGLTRTGSTFFFIDEGADTGDILDQEEITIDEIDDAGTLYAKMVKTALCQIERFMPKLMDGTYQRVPQNSMHGNVWRKRGKEDGRIDFRMNSRAIYDLVRGLTHPYVGAHLVYGGQEIKVWKVREVSEHSPHEEFGKVLRLDGREIIVKCYGGAVGLLDHEFKILPKPGEYLL